MRKFDVLILGNGKTARDIAERWAGSPKKIGVICPTEIGTVPLQKILTTIKNKNPSDENIGFPTNMEVLDGFPAFVDKKILQIGTERIAAEKFVIATGASINIPPFRGAAEVQTRSILEFLTNPGKFKSVTIIGAGPLGVSLAYRAATLEKEVTLVGRRSRILPDEEPEISASVKERLSEKNIKVETGAVMLEARKEGPGMALVIEQEGIRRELRSEEIIFATGLSPNLKGMNLNLPGVYINEGKAVAVDEQMRTSCPWIYAAGLVIAGKTNLGLINYQTRLAAHNVMAPFFAKIRAELEPIPFVIPLDPPFARTGLTEKEAREKYKGVRVSVTKGPEGFIKLVGRKKGARLLGAHIFSAHAEEAILFFNLALRAEISLLDLLEEQHYPPLTFAETIQQSIKTHCA